MLSSDCADRMWICISVVFSYSSAIFLSECFCILNALFRDMDRCPVAVRR
jgi:hypothetical protein